MSLFDALFMNSFEGRRIKALEASTRRRNRATERESITAHRLIDELQKDVGFLALTLAALLQKVEEKGILTRDEVRAAVEELDELDGVKDGRLDVGVLKDM